MGRVFQQQTFLKKYTILKNKITPKDNIRLISTLHTCLDMTEKDFGSLANNLNDGEKRPIYNLEWLGISFAKSKSKNARREPLVNKKEMVKQFKMKSKSLDYNFLRSSPKLEGIVEQCSKYELSRTDFPFVEEPKGLVPVKMKNYQVNNNVFGGDNEEDDEPYLIVFVLGGISHNEICSMEKLKEEKKISHHLVIASTSIMTASSYVDQLKDLTVPHDYNGNNLSTQQQKIDVTDIELGFVNK